MPEKYAVQEDLVGPLARITANLIRDADFASTLSLVTEVCAQVLRAATAATVIVDPRGGMRVLSTADARSRLVRLLETHTDDGPWRDSVATSTPVAVDNLDDDGRWPNLVGDAVAAGYHAIYAAPMVLGTHPVGSLALFYHDRFELGRHHRALAQTLADLTTLSLCQETNGTRLELLARQSLTALDDRVLFEHALGMTAARLDIETDHAAALLDRHARANDLSLIALSRHITTGQFNWTDLG